MRKLILIAAISLLASQAHAGGSRSLSLAASNASQATEQPAMPQAPSVAPPANVQTATTTPAAVPAQTTAAPTTAATPAATGAVATTPVPSTAAPVANASETAKPKHRQPSMEARVIRELHRHGIYW